MSVKILQPLLAAVRDRYGERQLREVIAASGMSREEIEVPSRWASHAQIEAVLKGARALMKDDAEFREACAYQMDKQYGPILHVLRAASPMAIARIMVRTMHFISRVTRCAMEEETRTSVRLRYTSDHKDSRLMCLSRQAAVQALPPLWGLPKATLVEEACMAHGDEACVYLVRWYDSTRLGPPILGGVLGFGLAWVLENFSSFRIVEAVSLTLLGAMLGLLLELRRTNRQNLEHGNQSHEALEALGNEYATAMSELMLIYQREQAWGRALEERMRERQATFDRMAVQLSSVRGQRESALRSLSHDLRNPLQIVRMGAQVIRGIEPLGHDALEVLDDIDRALDRTDVLLRDLMQFAAADGTVFETRAERIEVPRLAESIRGSLRALVILRDIRVSVFVTREAPTFIESDATLLNRIIDNIISNAAKYTERGSIVVELSGRPGALCVMVTDTGRGISSERLEAVFRAGRADASPIIGDSYGLGLSVVARILGQIGGNLEVMSKPGVGTTFWIYVPVKLPEASSTPIPLAPHTENIDDVLRRVVKIRSVANDG